MTDIVSLHDFAADLKFGCSLGIPNDNSGVSIAGTVALINARVGDLHLICCPISGLQADLLIGNGNVRRLETSAVSLGEAGPAPRFNAAVRAGAFQLMDATCPAIFAGLLAAQKGLSFMPIPGIIGSDLLRVRPDWKVIPDPMAEGSEIVIVPAIAPDIALFHASEADRHGNVWIGRRRELATMAYAAKQTIVTVERIVDGDLLADERSAAGVLPGLYVDRIAVAKRGAWPVAMAGEYPADMVELARYAAMARTAEGFRAYMSDFAARKEVAA